MNIIIKKNLIFYKGYKIKCSIGKSGVKKTKKEGDLSTPQGVFSLGYVYYRKDRNFLTKSSLKKKIIKKNMGWCNDIKSEKYNKQILFPFKYSAEKLYRKDASYDIFIEIKYNYSPVIKGNGSAIFMHIAKKNYKPTEGCIALSKKDLIKILPLIKKNTKISIRN
jgi:L,D-peptidoglycan transpeptidase YkuD (ErfK/YbiS/YcfS/YnhG family)